MVSGSFYRDPAGALDMALLDVAGDDRAAVFVRRLELAEQAFADGRDFVFPQTRAADEAAQTGKPLRKVKAVEELDPAFQALTSSFAGNPGGLYGFSGNLKLCNSIRRFARQHPLLGVDAGGGELPSRLCRRDL